MSFSIKSIFFAHTPKSYITSPYLVSNSPIARKQTLHFTSNFTHRWLLCGFEPHESRIVHISFSFQLTHLAGLLPILSILDHPRRCSWLRLALFIREWYRCRIGVTHCEHAQLNRRNGAMEKCGALVKPGNVNSLISWMKSKWFSWPK